MLRKALAFVIALAVSACSLLLGEGYTSPPDAEGGDASPDTTTATDGAAAGDATDAHVADGADADAGNLCNLQGSFCDDFDRAQLKGLWDTVTISGDAGLALVASPATKGSLLQATINELGDTAILEKQFTTTPTRLHIAFTLAWGEPPSVGACYVAGIVMPNAAASVSLVYFYAEQTGIYFVEQITDGTGYQRDPVPMAPGTPHRIVLDYDFKGPVTITVDGVAVVDRAASTFLQVQPPKLTVGAASIDNSGKGFTDRLDDLVFHVE